MYSAGPVYQALAALPLPPLPSTVAQWIPGQSPFSTHTEVVTALAVYLAVIFGGQWLMADRKPFREFQHSNACQSIFSSLLCCGIARREPEGSSATRAISETRPEQSRAKDRACKPGWCSFSARFQSTRKLQSFEQSLHGPVGTERHDDRKNKGRGP